tara:strand:- start:1426 stop:1935 length:510 start_codon:yes stop_codon:yes gene_type:complete
MVPRGELEDFAHVMGNLIGEVSDPGTGALAAHYRLTAMLAASPSVGEGEPVVCAVCDGFVPTWGVKVCDCEYMAPCGTKPAPPLVSTGSRPQEAVPTEPSLPTVLALLEDARSMMRIVSDGFEDEGDRTYLGSTNHADWLRAKAEKIEAYFIANDVEPADGCSSNEGVG